MNRWVAIGGGVFAAHLLVFAIVADWRVLPKKRHVPPPNFGAAQATYTEPETGEKVTVREFTVTTKLTPSPAPEPEATAAEASAPPGAPPPAP